MHTTPLLATALSVLVLSCGSGPTPPDSSGPQGPPHDDPSGGLTGQAPPGSAPAGSVLLPSDAGSVEPEQQPCSTVLAATIRDFDASHPDFETFAGDAAYPGLVQNLLGDDQKPVYAHSGPTAQTAGPEPFSQWYHDAPGVNLTYAADLPLQQVRPGVFGFGGPGFFPVDGLGFGDSGEDLDGVAHNFHFTTEVHTEFVYAGGEVFTFKGDDDMWLFVNRTLAIDLGGLHPEVSAVLDLDSAAGVLGITPGNTYAMDIFHAERHTEASNFYLETTIDCFHAPAPPK